MVNENVFRQKTESTEEVAKKPDVYKTNVPTQQETTVEPLFTEYEKANNHPFLVDYYKLGDTWKDKLGGFEKEINLIEGYFRDRIEQGQMKNEIAAVKEQLKRIYKLCNIDNSERTTMQIEKLAAYIEFLKKTDNISLNHYKYSNR